MTTDPTAAAAAVLDSASLPVLRDVSTFLKAGTAGDIVMWARQAYGRSTELQPAVDTLTELVRAAHPNAHRLTTRQVGALRRKVSDAIHEKETPQ